MHLRAKRPPVFHARCPVSVAWRPYLIALRAPPARAILAALYQVHQRRPTMPPPRRPRRGPKPDRRRALELLAASPDGCTEAIMLAHGFTVGLMVDLCVAGLAIAHPEQMRAGGRTVEVVRMKITEPGRRALYGSGLITGGG